MQTSNFSFSGSAIFFLTINGAQTNTDLLHQISYATILPITNYLRPLTMSKTGIQGTSCSRLVKKSRIKRYSENKNYKMARSSGLYEKDKYKNLAAKCFYSVRLRTILDDDTYECEFTLILNTMLRLKKYNCDTICDWFHLTLKPRYERLDTALEKLFYIV